MGEKEINYYLKKVDELYSRLDEEDKEILDWLVYGYNECAKKLLEKEDIIEEVKEYIYELKTNSDEKVLDNILDILDKEI